MASWLACQTKPRCESYAAELLADNGFVPYLPLARITSRHAGKISQNIEPLFSRYLFVEHSPRASEMLRIRRGVVTAIIMQGDRHAIVRQAVIDSIRARETNGAVEINELPRPFAPGERIRIANGPMTGLEAVYSRPHGDARAHVLLMLCGSQRLATVFVDDIRAAAS